MATKVAPTRISTSRYRKSESFPRRYKPIIRTLRLTDLPYHVKYKNNNFIVDKEYVEKRLFRAEVREGEKQEAKSERNKETESKRGKDGKGVDLIRLFLPDLTAEEIVKIYLEGNRSFEALVNRLAERAIGERERMKERTARALRSFLLEVTKEMAEIKTVEEILAFLESREITLKTGVLSRRIRSGLRLSEDFMGDRVNQRRVHDLVLGAAERGIVPRQAVASASELGEIEKSAGFIPSIAALFDLFDGNQAGLEAFLNQAAKEDSFRAWHERTYHREAPSRLFEEGTRTSTPQASVFDLALFRGLLKSGGTEPVKRLLADRSQRGRVAVTIPPGFGSMEKIFVPGTDYFGYGEEGLAVNRMGYRLSKEYLESMMLVSLETPVDAGNFKGFGYFTESSVMELLRLDPSSFVRLLELAHRSEPIWNSLDKDSQGRNAFRVVGPRGIASLIEFVYQLTQTQTARQALLRAA